MSEFFYRPEGAWAADFIPLYAKGEFRLFYLQDWRDHEGHGEGTPWYQISTTDFVHFKEHGEMLPRGSKEEQDLYVFTGSAIEAEGGFHIFYTGHNPHFQADGSPEQGVMRAVSDDLIHWRKLPDETFFAPTDAYEPHDWRDPFVFWNEEAGEYGMLLAARVKTGPSRRRGCTAYCASQDLKRWEPREPFWSPELYFTHECPDLFKMGDWWYLVYSTFSEKCVTHYRMSRSLSGPWVAPESDAFDGRAFYAAKTASDGERRFVFGWNPTRAGETDGGGWQWGGNLAVHEILQEPDGSLSVRPPKSVSDAFQTAIPTSLRLRLGKGSAFGGDAEIATAGFGCATAGEISSPGKIEATIRFEPGTRGCGILLRASDDLEKGYYLRLEPGMNRLVFDSWPRPGDQPFHAGLERPIALKPDAPVRLTVFLDGTVCEAYVDDKIALSARMYDHPAGEWGVFVNEGATRFSEVKAFGL